MAKQMWLHPVFAHVCGPLCQVEAMATQEREVRVATISSSSPLLSSSSGSSPSFSPPPFLLLSSPPLPPPPTHHRPLTAKFEPVGGHRPSSTLPLAPSLTYHCQSEKVLTIQGTCGASRTSKTFKAVRHSSPLLPFPALPILGFFHHLRP